MMKSYLTLKGWGILPPKPCKAVLRIIPIRRSDIGIVILENESYRGYEEEVFFKGFTEEPPDPFWMQ